MESKWAKIKADTKNDELEGYIKNLLLPKVKKSAKENKSLLSNPLLRRVKNSFEKKKLSVVFDKYVEEHKDALGLLGLKLRNSLKYNEIYKYAHNESVMDKYRDDPKVVYFK